MPIWPFNRKRRAAAKDLATQPLTEKFQSAANTRPTSIEPPPAVVRKLSRKESTPQRNVASQQASPPLPPTSRSPEEATLLAPSRSYDETTLPPPLVRPPMSKPKSEKPQTAASAGKENVRPRTRHSSDEDITALPISRRLENSPHLRAVELDRPAAIAYSVRPYSASQTSMQRAEPAVSPPSRPRTLRSKRSVNDGSTIPRRQSTKKRRNDHVREEEIRAMSSSVPIPPRPGGYADFPLRRDSKKARGVGGKSSAVSLPPVEPSMHSSTLSGITEQRGWEIGALDVFNPRPAVRLSGTPQYVNAGSAPGTSYLTRELSRRGEKKPVSRSSGRKRQTVGNQVEDLDTTELRLILERDAKRRERKKKDQQEKLDKKLRSRSGRNRGDSDRSQRRREAEEALQRSRETTSPPTALHPAFRDRPSEEAFDAAALGIVGQQAITRDATASEDLPREDPVPAENPFDDPVHQEERVPTPVSDDMPHIPGAFSPVATPLEEPTVATAEAISLSQPPISSIRSHSRTPQQGFSPADTEERQMSELPPPPPITAMERKRASDPPREATRRGGAWAAFFRRSTQRRPNDPASQSEASFSNISRESMRNQTLPAHLVDTTRPASVQRRRSETPVSRTQSRFREDLPESLVAVSPPDSRIPSPDVTTAAGLAATARRGNRFSQPVDIPPRDSLGAVLPAGAGGSTRNDTPVSPSIRGHGLMSASLASIDSEGSWLAGGSSMKRQSVQSGLSRSISKRKQQQQQQQQSGGGSAGGLGSATSYEDLGGGGGGDRDAEYFQRMTPSPDQGMTQLRFFTTSTAGGQGEGEAEGEGEGEGEAEAAPPTVHDSIVRRRPTLVHGEPRVKSREGLLAEYSAGPATPNDEDQPEEDKEGGSPSSAVGENLTETYPDDNENEEDGGDTMHRATSISYRRDRGHVRQISAGSARLLEVSRRRPSADQGVISGGGSAPGSGFAGAGSGAAGLATPSSLPASPTGFGFGQG